MTSVPLGLFGTLPPEMREEIYRHTTFQHNTAIRDPDFHCSPCLLTPSSGPCAKLSPLAGTCKQLQQELETYALKHSRTSHFHIALDISRPFELASRLMDGSLQDISSSHGAIDLYLQLYLVAPEHDTEDLSIPLEDDELITPSINRYDLWAVLYRIMSRNTRLLVINVELSAAVIQRYRWPHLFDDLWQLFDSYTGLQEVGMLFQSDLDDETTIDYFYRISDEDPAEDDNNEHGGTTVIEGWKQVRDCKRANNGWNCLKKAVSVSPRQDAEFAEDCGLDY